MEYLNRGTLSLILGSVGIILFFTPILLEVRVFYLVIKKDFVFPEGSVIFHMILAFGSTIGVGLFLLALIVR